MTFLYNSVYLDNPIVMGRALDIMEPSCVTKNKALIFIHGGGWRNGTRQQMHTIMQAFLANGYICASFDYRLNNVTAFEQLTDLRHAYDFFVSYLKQKKSPPEIITYGSSAGAHLCALMSFAKPGTCHENLKYGNYSLKNKWVRPLGSIFQSIPVTITPWEDIFPGSWKCFTDITGTPYEENPEVYRILSPIEHINEHIQKVFFMNASNEHMFPICFVENAADKIRSYGQNCICKTYHNAEHGFFYDTIRRVQKKAFIDVLKFISTL